jgi:hypothetical protein
MSDLRKQPPDTETDPKLSVIHKQSGGLLGHQHVKKVFWKESRSMVRAESGSTDSIPFQEGDMCILVYGPHSVDRELNHYGTRYANSDLLKFPPWHDDI